MRALIVGASGLLGHALYRRWTERGWDVAGTYREFALDGLRRLDVLEPGSLDALLEELKPRVVAFPASIPHVDYCQQHPEETRRLNVDATLSAARAAREAGARFVFFSTDYVFDGRRGGYTESDAPAPLGAYGRQKLEAERGLLAVPGALVLRVCGLFGWEFRQKNFVLQAVRRLKAGERFQAAEDQSYTPTYVPFLADAVGDLAERGAEGLLHLAGSERLSRVEFARAAAEAFGLDAGLVEPVGSASLTRPGAAPRPADSSLDCSKAAALLGRPVPGAREGLKAMARAQGQWEEYAAQKGAA